MTVVVQPNVKTGAHHHGELESIIYVVRGRAARRCDRADPGAHGLGELALAAQRRGGGRLLPVDSEHSALFQCLEGHNRSEVRRILLTASGGPFRTMKAADLARVTVAEALNHPTWRMGAKITVTEWWVWNQIPVTLGNLVGGLAFTGLTLYATHIKTAPKRDLHTASRRAA